MVVFSWTNQFREVALNSVFQTENLQVLTVKSLYFSAPTPAVFKASSNLSTFPPHLGVSWGTVVSGIEFPCVSWNKRCTCSIINLMLKAAAQNKEDKTPQEWQKTELHFQSIAFLGMRQKKESGKKHLHLSSIQRVHQVGELKSSCARVNTANVGSQKALLEGHHGQSSRDQTEAYPVLNNSICSKCYTQYKQWDFFRILLPPSLFFCLPNSNDITHIHLSEGKLPSSLCVNHHTSPLPAQPGVPTVRYSSRWDTQLKKC